MNAFADHFLEDAFGSGHLRVDRRMPTGRKEKDLCAKVCKDLLRFSLKLTVPSQYMHNEDNVLGLDVENPRGDKWKCYGDKRLADKVDRDNLKYCKEAVQASTDKIYDCFVTKKIPKVEEYRV